MWWFLKKLLDNDNEVVYAYGRETKNVTGEIKYNRLTDKFELVKLAENDMQRGFKWLLPHFYRVIFKENAPNERQIAIG